MNIATSPVGWDVSSWQPCRYENFFSGLSPKPCSACFFFQQMSAHVDADGDCPLAVVPCQYTDIGCKFKVRLHWGVKTISASVLFT